MPRLPPEKRPLLVGVVLALVGLGISLRWPLDRRLDVVWTALMVATAACIVDYERRLRAQGRPWPALRWVAALVAALGLLWLLWARA